MCFTLITPAFAAGKAITGTEDQPAQAAIAKVLKVPFGTAVPNATFKFFVTALEVDGKDFNITTPNMPILGQPVAANPGVGIFELEFGKATNPGEEIKDRDTDGITTWVYETADIFYNAQWKNAGIYKYEIREESNTYTIVDGTKETMTYSGATYTLDVFVSEYTNRPGEFYVSAIAAVITSVDHDGQDEGDKVDPTPGGNTVTMTGYSDMTFTNTYWKHNGGTDPQDPNDWTLAVSKTVDGTYGNKGLYFDFAMKIAAPILVPHVPNAPVYKAYVVEADPNNQGKYIVVTSSDNYAGTIGTDLSISFTSRDNAATMFKLKDSQYLVFINTPVGTYYEVTESASEFYKASVSIIYDGRTPVNYSNLNLNTALTIPNSSILTELHTDRLYVGEAENRANFINTRGEITPTGLNLNNLPFIAMIALAIASLVMFVAFRSRKRRSYTQF